MTTAAPGSAGFALASPAGSAPASSPPPASAAMVRPGGMPSPAPEGGDRFEPHVVRLPDPAAVGAWVADLLLADRREGSGQPLGLATGRTMEPVYAALAARLAALPERERQAVRDGWLSFNLDDYVGLGPEDPRSFAAEMERRLVAPLALDRTRVRLPAGRAADPDAEACRYSAAVTAAGGIGLQLLGLGANGHLGFNEPPSGPALPCRVVRLCATTRDQNASAFGGDPAAVPERAITLGLREILAARRLLLVVTGSAKAAILQRVLHDTPSEAVPASWIRLHPAAVVVADEAALGCAELR